MMSIVVIGGGIVGVSTAYFLAKHGLSVTLLEQQCIAAAASGKAGGFLAQDWCSHYEMDVLARKGFSLHMEFAKTMEKHCDYRCVDTFSIVLSQKSSTKQKSLPPGISNNANSCSKIGDKENTAQVHPFKLTNFLFEKTREWTNGVTELKISKVVGLNFSSPQSDLPKVTGVQVVDSSGKEEVIRADVVLLATGPWTKTALSWLPSGSIESNGFSGHRAHGIVLHPNREDPHSIQIGATCFFTEFSGQSYSCSPEVYPRPDGTVYICGLSDNAPVPSSPQEVVTEEWRFDRMREVASMLSSSLKEAETKERNACYLPLSPDGIPAIGMIPNVQGVYVGTGHSCWGILTGPITGRFLAAMIARELKSSEPACSSILVDEEEVKVSDKLLSDPEFKVFDPRRFVSKVSSRAKQYTTKKPE